MKFLAISACVALVVMSLGTFGVYAQERQKSSQYDPPCEVKWRDAKSASRDAVHTTAAQISVDSQTIVLFGGNREIWDQIVEGACRQIEANRTRLNGVILALETESENPAEIQFYADSQLTATILRASTDAENPLAKVVSDQLGRDFQLFFE